MRDTLTLPDVHVGHLYEKGRTKRSEGTSYHYRDGEHELAVFVDGVGRPHIRAVAEDEAEFALLVEGEMLVFLSRFGEAIPWSASYYWWHLIPRGVQKLPPTGPGQESRAPLYVTLVDAKTGLVHATRCTTLSLDFTRALHDAILEQARTPFDASSEKRALTRLTKRHATPGAMAAAARVRTFGSR
jgi:hypothetical protein